LVCSAVVWVSTLIRAEASDVVVTAVIESWTTAFA